MKFTAKLLTAGLGQIMELWAIFQDEVKHRPINDLSITHTEWFDEMGWPSSGYAFDRIPRGFARIFAAEHILRLVESSDLGGVPWSVVDDYQERFRGMDVQAAQLKQASFNHGLPHEWMNRLDENGFTIEPPGHVLNRDSSDFILEDGYILVGGLTHGFTAVALMGYDGVDDDEDYGALLEFYQQTGAIRISGKSHMFGFEIHNDPTPAQIREIARLCGRQPFTWDLYRSGRPVAGSPDVGTSMPNLRRALDEVY